MDVHPNNTASQFTAKLSEVIELECNKVYIYCDVLEHIIVGDTKTPLWHTVNGKTVRESGIRQHQTHI